jgi:hypothetical protein
MVWRVQSVSKHMMHDIGAMSIRMHEGRSPPELSTGRMPKGLGHSAKKRGGPIRVDENPTVYATRGL